MERFIEYITKYWVVSPNLLIWIFLVILVMASLATPHSPETLLGVLPWLGASDPFQLPDVLDPLYVLLVKAALLIHQTFTYITDLIEQAIPFLQVAIHYFQRIIEDPRLRPVRRILSQSFARWCSRQKPAMEILPGEKPGHIKLHNYSEVPVHIQNVCIVKRGRFNRPAPPCGPDDPTQKSNRPRIRPPNQTQNSPSLPCVLNSGEHLPLEVTTGTHELPEGKALLRIDLIYKDEQRTRFFQVEVHRDFAHWRIELPKNRKSTLSLTALCSLFGGGRT